MNVTHTSDGRIVEFDNGLVLTVLFDRTYTVGHWSEHYTAYRVTLAHLNAPNVEIISWTGDSELRLPWVDHDRALRDAVGFLEAYATGEGNNATDSERAALEPYADILEELGYELSDDDDDYPSKEEIYQQETEDLHRKTR